MNMPELIIIAGPNGSGKSSSATQILKSLGKSDLKSFDFDKIKLENYVSDFEHEYREKMAHNKTLIELENAIGDAIKEKKDFCYETNFQNDSAMYWANLFVANGFKVKMIYLALETLKTSIERVEKRVLTGGHDVPLYQIKQRFEGSKKNINKFYKKFDDFIMVDGSTLELNTFLTASKGIITNLDSVPNYIYKLYPKIGKDIKDFILNN